MSAISGPRLRATPVWPVAASVVAHALVIGLVGVAAYRSLAARERAALVLAPSPASSVIAIELPLVSDGALVEDRADVLQGAPPSARGGATVARMDHGVPGRGGEATSSLRAINLADDDDGLVLSPDLTSHLARDQHQRLRTADARATREDRRSTTNPMELTFLASGKGERQERRAVSERDPSRGAMIAPPPSVLGGAPGTHPDSESEPGEGAVVGAANLGRTVASPGPGVRDGREGLDHRASARVAYGRPSVTEGPVAVPAITRGRPNDTKDSDQEVATTVRALVHASVAGGLPGVGRGGSEAPPETVPGAGGAIGRGSVARPLGAGDGDVFDWFTSDPQLLPYFRRIHTKVDPLWRDAFPKSAMLELKQGTVILEFTVASDGSARVSWPPVRPSGIEEFDRNCADAIRRASPFEPIPASLGRTSLRIRAPFVAKNPIIK